MITLPTALADTKDNSSVDFCDLYVIRTISGNMYICANDEDIWWYDPQTGTPVLYMAQPIQRGKLSQSTDDKIDNVDLQISNVTENFSSAMFQSFDFRGTMVDIYQIHRVNSIGEPTAYKYVFYGYIDVPALNESTGVFTCTLMQVIPNMESCRTFMLTCNAWFGDEEECGAEEKIVTSTVASRSTQNIINHANDNSPVDYYKNGVISIGYESKKIIASTSTSITVEYPFFSVPTVGTPIVYQNGCDRSYPDCLRHNNTKNFSGFKSLPSQLVIRA